MEPERTDDAGSGQQNATRHGFRYSFLHNRSVRARVAGLVFIPLLGALIFGASVFYGAIRDYTTASSVESHTETVRSVLTVIDRLQDERDVSALLRAGVNGDGPVASARDQTDQAIADLTARFEEVPQDDPSPFSNASAEARETLEMLGDARGVDGSDANIERYRMLIRSLLAVVQASGTGLTDAELSEEIGVLNALARSTEAASLERGLVAQLVAIGEDVSNARNRFLAVTRTEQDLLLEPFAATAEPADWIAYSEARKDVDEVRRDLIASGTQVATPHEWYDVASNRVNVMRELQGKYGDAIAQDASDAASSARLAAAATALVVFAVLVLTILSAFAVARSIVRPLRRLRSAALVAADTGLPALVSRIQEDGPAVVRRIGDAVTPEGTDEIGQVASAFNEVHATAVRVAGEQALLRQNLDTIVVNLSRRTQSLVDRQLGEIEDLESRERDPDQLGTLFRIDHLATRVRRHAESLLVLAGVEEMRRQGVAAPVLDVVRTAVGEVEQYPRIKFGVMPTDLVVPSAVDDVAHLLAELLDNATEFSAPSTAVTVTSQPLLGGGLRLQVTDQGLGIPADQLAMLNERLRQPGDIDVAASRTLGIYVVARLAARHGITVRLIPAEATSGTIAQVDLPSHLIVSPLDTTDGVLQAIQPTPPRTESLLDRPNLNREVAGPNQLPQRPTHTSPITQPAVPVARQSDDGPTRPDGSEGKDDLSPTGRPDQGGRPTPGDTRPGQPGRGDRTRQPVTADGRNNAPASTGYQVPTPGVSPLQPQTSPLQPAMSAFHPPTARSLRGDGAGDDGTGGVSDSPIYDSVRSAWFKRGGSSDWSSPADEGWRRAAAVLRTVETATAPPTPVGPASPAAAGPLPVASSPVPPVPGGLATGSPSGGRVGPAPWTSGGTPGPSAQPGRPPQPASPSRPASPVLPGSPAQSGPPGLPSRSVGHPDAGRGQPGGPGQPGMPVPPAKPPAQSEPVSARSSSGLPVRQRGATLVPGSIPGAEQAAGAGSGRRADASNVASTLSNLQRGVSRGREESGGWVPKRPGDSERSNS